MTSVNVKLEKPLLWPMYSAFLAIGIVCSLLIAAVYLFTLPYVRANKEAALNQAVVSVLGDVHSKHALNWQDGKWIVSRADQASSSDHVFAGYDAKGSLLGFAIAAKGMGYQDSIELMYGYAPERQAITGISILENRETPGLGNRIASDKNFLAQFQHLDVTLDASKQRLANVVAVARKGQKAKPWQVDSISGATISSKAVARIINDSAQRWLPRLQDDVKAFAIDSKEP